jgi:hypothetical protein
MCSTGDSIFEHACTSEPRFTDACSPDIGNARNPNIASASLAEVGITCRQDIANARGYASRKSA